MDGISLSNGAALAVGGLLTALSGAIGTLFWALIASKNASISREQDLTNKLLPAVEENTRTLTRVVELMVSQQEEARRERDELKKILERVSNRGRSA